MNRFWLGILILLTGASAYARPKINPLDIKPGTVSETEFGYLGNITSDVQTQLDTLVTGTNALQAQITAIDLTEIYTSTNALQTQITDLDGYVNTATNNLIAGTNALQSSLTALDGYVGTATNELIAGTNALMTAVLDLQTATNNHEMLIGELIVGTNALQTQVDTITAGTATNCVVFRTMGSSADATFERSIFATPDAVTIVSIYILPDAAITAHAANYFTLTVQNKGTDGSGTDSVASLAFDTPTTDDVAQYATKSLGAISGFGTMSAGEALTIKKTIAVDGMASPDMTIMVYYVYP